MFALVAVIMVMSCPIIVAYDDDVEETDAFGIGIVGIALVIAFAAGAGSAYLLDNWGDDHVPDGASQGEINAEFRRAQAELISSNWGTASGMWSKLADNDAMLWPFVEAYFDLQAETAASYLWSDDGIYTGDKVLEMSSFLSNSMTYNFNLTSAWNEFSDSWSDRRDLWKEKGQAYDSMELAFAWGSSTWSSETGVFGADLMRFVTPTSSSDRIYIEVVDSEDQGYTDRTNIMTCIGPGKITSATTGRTWELQSGENDLGRMGVYTGWYELGHGSTYIAQNISGSVSEDGLMPSACMLMRNDGEQSYAFMSGEYPTVVRNGQSVVTDSLSMTVSFDDNDGTTVVKTVDLLRVLEGYDGVVKAMTSAALSVNNAGQAAWEVFDHLGTSSALIKPSSIIAGTQGGMPLTPQQSTAMYLSAMAQLMQLGEGATADGIRISPESMTLYCHGDIYYRGVQIAKDAVYTPFVYSDTSISVGIQDVDVNGLAMVWATDIPSLDDWNGVTDNSAIVDISGATLDIRSIIHDGKEVSGVDLEVESMERLGLIGYDAPDPSDPPKTVDIVPLIQIVAILIGAIVAIIGLATGSPWMMVAGIVVAIAGYMVAGWVAGMIY